MMHLLRSVGAGLPMMALAALLAGCATTQMTSQWKSPNFAGGSLKGQRVLVLCQARDDTLRRVCEDQWAGQLGLQEVVAVRAYTIPGIPPGGAANPDEIKAAARVSGAVAVASMQLVASDFAAVNPGPQVGIGIGGGSGGYRSGFSIGGFGLSFPVGGATATQGLSSNTSLLDPASGALVWSGSASTAAVADLVSQVSALTQVTIDALQKAGMI